MMELIGFWLHFIFVVQKYGAQLGNFHFYIIMGMYSGMQNRAFLEIET